MRFERRWHLSSPGRLANKCLCLLKAKNRDDTTTLVKTVGLNRLARNINDEKGLGIAMSAEAAVKESFADLLEESLGSGSGIEGSVVKGTIIAIENDFAVIDAGLKSEGRVALREFIGPDETANLKVGGSVDVYLERMENKNGEAVLSREKARREEAWTMLEHSFNETERVTGTIFGRVKGGFTVDLSGAVAFLPGSQVDIRPVRDIGPLMGAPQPFQILKMDRSRGNIVVSRRAVLEESRAEQRTELIANLKEGQVLEGVVKNITDYGAFVDLGGVDGLLHVTDIAWRRINHPSESLTIGQTLNASIPKPSASALARNSWKLILGMALAKNTRLRPNSQAASLISPIMARSSNSNPALKALSTSPR